MKSSHRNVTKCETPLFRGKTLPARGIGFIQAIDLAFRSSFAIDAIIEASPEGRTPTRIVLTGNTSIDLVPSRDRYPQLGHSSLQQKDSDVTVFRYDRGLKRPGEPA